MRRSEDFRRTVRRGVRAGRPTVVVHALCAGGVSGPDGQLSTAPLVGFVVSRSVGSAVHRNRVRRRLRHLTMAHLPSLSERMLVVVRALPPAATAGAELGDDLGAAWTAVMQKLAASAKPDRP